MRRGSALQVAHQLRIGRGIGQDGRFEQLAVFQRDRELLAIPGTHAQFEIRWQGLPRGRLQREAEHGVRREIPVPVVGCQRRANRAIALPGDRAQAGDAHLHEGAGIVLIGRVGAYGLVLGRCGRHGGRSLFIRLRRQVHGCVLCGLAVRQRLVRAACVAGENIQRRDEAEFRRLRVPALRLFPIPLHAIALLVDPGQHQRRLDARVHRLRMLRIEAQAVPPRIEPVLGHVAQPLDRRGLVFGRAEPVEVHLRQHQGRVLGAHLRVRLLEQSERRRVVAPVEGLEAPLQGRVLRFDMGSSALDVHVQ